MVAQLDPRVTELLCARLCHDLIGPISAINNGVEFVRDFGDEMKGEAFTLIAESASKASRLLQLYRVAFGSARAADGSGIGLDEARQRAIDALASERVTIDWPAGVALEQGSESRSLVKLVLNLVLTSVEILPGAGTVTVHIECGQPMRMQVTAEKEGLSLSEDFGRVLDGEIAVEDLSPRTVQAYLTRSLAESVGARIEVAADAGHLSLVVELKT
ncbi:MAG: histidine phosphotransferase family protein [Alphaproteobacteria bacterium]|nr:histidine phosphotransferase family protein [Alphaproteobacteria bacterium]